MKTAWKVTNEGVEVNGQKAEYNGKGEEFTKYLRTVQIRQGVFVSLVGAKTSFEDGRAVSYQNAYQSLHEIIPQLRLAQAEYKDTLRECDKFLTTPVTQLFDMDESDELEQFVKHFCESYAHKATMPTEAQGAATEGE